MSKRIGGLVALGMLALAALWVAPSALANADEGVAADDVAPSTDYACRNYGIYVVAGDGGCKTCENYGVTVWVGSQCWGPYWAGICLGALCTGVPYVSLEQPEPILDAMGDGVARLGRAAD